MNGALVTCPACRSAVAAAAVACPRCGHPFQAGHASATRYLVGLVALIGVLAVGWWVLQETGMVKP